MKTRCMFRPALFGFQLTLLAGCATVQREEVAGWREAVVAVREQSAAAFAAYDDLIRDFEIRRAAQRAKLDPADFAGALDRSSLQHWREAFDALDGYAAAVDRLLGDEVPRDAATAIETTGKQIAATAGLLSADGSGPVASALGGIGKSLVANAAGARAADLMRAADGDVQRLLAAMAAMLHRPATSGRPEAGLLVAQRVTWDQRLAEIEASFGDAKDGDARRAVAKHYLEVIEQRDASERAMLGLRRSLLDLGPAHTAAAAGRRVGIADVVALARAQAGELAALREQLRGSRGRQP